MKEINGINEFLQMSMTNNMPLSVNEKRQIFDLIINLQNQLQQKENIIKEVREYIKNLTNFQIGYGLNENDIKRTMYASEKNFVKDILGILDKYITKKSDYNYEKVEKENKE